MLIRRAVISGCAVALLAAACSSGGGSSAAPSTTKRDRPSTTVRRGTTTVPTTIPTATTLPRTPLQDLILRDAGDGFLLQPDELADTGHTNIAKAAEEETGANAREALDVTKFLDGWQRQWTKVDTLGNTNNTYVYLYEFEAPGGAQLYAQQWRQSLEQLPHPGVELSAFTPVDIPGGTGLVSKEIKTKNPERSGATGVVMFSKGTYAVKVIVNGDQSVDQAAAATQLANAQYQRLP